MEETREVTDLADRFEFTPVDGHRNQYLIRIKESPRGLTGRQMTEEELDKFEKDINDAFEQIP